MLSASMEDYLKAIYHLSAEGDRATTRALAERLGVTPASVSGMLQRLSASRPAWVIHEKRRGARLTRAGRRRALEILRHHRLMEAFLHEVLGYEWDQVHAEAEKLEHAVSDALEDRIAARLGHPVKDPHGHPIPGKDGSMPHRTLVPLSELAVGRSAIVAQVNDRDPALLRHLGNLGLYPDAPLRVTRIHPFGGSIMIEHAGRSLNLGRDAARQVMVECVPASPGTPRPETSTATAEKKRRPREP